MRISDWSSDVCSSDLCLYLAAGAFAVRPQVQELADLFDWKAEITGIGDETQSMHVRLRIVPIAAIAPWWWWDKSDLHIVEAHTLRDATRRCCAPYVHSATRLMRRDLVTPLTVRRDIPPPAVKGE